MKIRSWFAGALILTLLAALQGSLVHPIEHLDHAGEFVHLAGTTRDPDENGGPSALCDVIAAVAACVTGSAGFVLAAARGIEVFSPRQPDHLRRAPLLGYRSQAPPRHS